MSMSFPKKVKRPSKTQLKRKADQLFSEIIRRPGFCRRCGSTKLLQCAHIISRRYLSTRFDTDNALCLCSGCHVWFTHSPLEFEQWLFTIIGKEKYEALKVRALIHKEIDYHEVIAVLQEMDRDYFHGHL